MKIFCIILGIILFLNQVKGSNILFFSAIASKSHRHAFDPIMEELGKRGHNVVFFTSNKATRTLANVTEVYSEELAKTLQNGEIFFYESGANVRSAVLEIITNNINLSFSHPLIQDIIRKPRDVKTNAPKYDLLVIDAVMNDFALPLAYRMQIPVVYIAPAFLVLSHAWYMNIPFPVSSVSNGMTNMPLRMSFVDRTLNTFFSLRICIDTWLFLDVFDNLIKDYIPNVPKLVQLLHNVSFVISNDHPTLGRVAPTMPYYVQLGGLHCKHAQKLDDELENFMQSAGEYGVIYFSLGSFADGSMMPAEMKQKIAKAFAKLPQKILFKNEEVIEEMPKNVKFIKWAPQQDILGHSNVKLFISHAGSLSTQEAVYHGCPILGFPLIGDQFGNIASATSLGYAEYLDWKTFTTEDLLYKIKLMIEDPRYKMNAEKISIIFKDRPEHPAKTAAYWVEYVLRHHGAPHLKSGAEHLNFFQYFLLDVIIVVITAIVLATSIIVFLIKRVLYIYAGKHKQSQNKIKQKTY